MERAHLGRGLQDLGAERHDGAQHGQEPEDEEHAGGLDAVQPLALDQERGQQLRREGRGVRLAEALRGRGGAEPGSRDPETLSWTRTEHKLWPTSSLFCGRSQGD